ncbi:MAG: lamin tail domain-containing protein, partial [Candidatus Pacebacteria bacterium]|nr:lamin tail domain-containing protein [Candidatus Paceibacterota bacterium]
SEGDWPFGDNTLKKSMERKPDLSWQTYSGDSFGTPKASNSVEEIASPPEITYCPQEGLGLATHTPVIINEIAWMGTPTSFSDEWIELKNITSADISLSGYQLLDKDNQIDIIFEASDIILANSYYLLEKTDDDSVLGIEANKIYSGALSDSDESLRLFNGDCALVDEVVSEGDWPFGDNTLKKSMERKPDLSWQTYSGDSFGTPKASNSVDLTAANSYCESKEGFVDGDYCLLTSGKVCGLLDYYLGDCTDSNYASSLVIAEVSEGYNNDGREYVRIFNQSDEDISFCTGDKCLYLAYFTMDESGNSAKWNDPKRNIQLEKTTLSSNSYYQIDFNKDNGGDLKLDLEPLTDGEYYIYSNHGSFCLFNKDVTLLSEEEAKNAKIDCLGWINSYYFPYGKNDVSEYYAFTKSSPAENSKKRSLFRTKDETGYFDRDNNTVDFYFAKPTTYTVYSALNLKYTELPDKTKIRLSWDYNSDLDLENLSFKIQYTKNSDFSPENIIEIDGEDVVISSNHVEATVPLIEEGIDYRFKIKIIEDGKNVSNQEEPLFYIYISSFSNHLYTLMYDANRSNNTNYLGPQTNAITSKELMQAPIKSSFEISPIDKYGNFYFLHIMDRVSGGNSMIASYDKNGLLRWTYDFDDSYNYGKIILKDAIYYFSRDKLLKLSYRGELIFETYLENALGFENYLYLNDSLYFYCSLGAEKGLCRRDFSESGLTEVIYNSSTEISNLVVDIFGNIFFVAENNKLVKILSGGGLKELPIPSEEYIKINILNDKILISLSQKEILVDANLMVTLSSQDRETNLDLAVSTKNGFYLFESNGGYYGTLSFFDISDNSIKEISNNVERISSAKNKPVVDINNNIYYISLSSYLVGYKKEGDSISQIFSQSAGDYIVSEVVLLEGKLYYSAREKFIEVSF